MGPWAQTVSASLERRQFVWPSSSTPSGCGTSPARIFSSASCSSSTASASACWRRSHAWNARYAWLAAPQETARACRFGRGATARACSPSLAYHRRRAPRTADLILIACRPAAADLSAIGASIAIAQRTSTRTIAILNAAPVRNPLIDQARTALAGYDVDVAPVVVHHRIDHVHAFTSPPAPRDRRGTTLQALGVKAFAPLLDQARGEST